MRKCRCLDTLNHLTQAHPSYLPSELGSPVFPFLQIFDGGTKWTCWRQDRASFPFPPAFLHFPQTRTEPYILCYWIEVDSPSSPSFERKERGLPSSEEKTWLPKFSSGLRPGKSSWWSWARVCLGGVHISMSPAALLLPCCKQRHFNSVFVASLHTFCLLCLFWLETPSWGGEGGALASMACVHSTVCLWGDLDAVSTHRQCKQYK